MNPSYAVVHQHDYGTDCNVYASADDAYLSASCIIMQWLLDIDDEDIQRDIVISLKAREFTEAIRLYNTHHETETISVQACIPIKNDALESQFNSLVNTWVKDLDLTGD